MNEEEKRNENYLFPKKKDSKQNLKPRNIERRLTPKTPFKLGTSHYLVQT